MKLRKRAGKVISYIGAFFGLYVGAWLMLIGPILTAIREYQIGELTGALILVTILKCILAPSVGFLIYLTLAFIGGVIYYWGGSGTNGD
ncbi:MAG: hypothetical protein ACOYBE_01520 [Blautia sp.]